MSQSTQPVDPFTKLAEERRLPGGELSDGFAFAESFCFFLSPLFPSLLAFFSDILQSGCGISRLRSAVSLWMESSPRARSGGQLCSRVSVRWACVFYCARGGTNASCVTLLLSVCVWVCVCVCVRAHRRLSFFCISMISFYINRTVELLAFDHTAPQLYTHLQLCKMWESLLFSQNISISNIFIFDLKITV